MSIVESDAERSCRVARTAGGLGTLGLTADAIVGTPHSPMPAQLAAIVLCGTLWLSLLLTRRTPTALFGSAMFLAIIAAIIVGLSSSAQRLAESQTNWVPFRAHQLGMLAVALLAPPIAWVGVVAILALLGAALLQFQLFGPAIREHLPYGDPWSTIAFAGFALPLLFYRLNADRNEREMARAQAEAEAYQRTARAMLAIRDLANTPLQTLTIIAALLRARATDLDATVAQLERAVARMSDLDALLRSFEPELGWHVGDEAWDPKAILRASAVTHPAD